MTSSSFTGVHAILYAFFDSEGRLDRALMRRQVEACLASGAHGVAALGLATEVNKLTTDERRQVMDWVCEDVGGRVPVAITIAGETIADQSALAAHAASAGADWLVLQPPPIKDRPEDFYVDFFAGVMASTRLPAAIQNAAAYLGVGLSAEGIAALRSRAKNFTLIKGEGPAIEIAELVAAAGAGLTVFNGRGGLEFPDNLRAGCAGLIPAPDVVDHLVRIHEAFRNGDEAEAERIYAEILPCIVFVMQSLATLITYGKRIVAWRMGVPEVFDREPVLQPTAFGLAAARRFADRLGPYAAGR